MLGDFISNLFGSNSFSGDPLSIEDISAFAKACILLHPIA
jgi:hypothetical protein